MPSLLQRLALGTAMIGASALASIAPSDSCPISSSSQLSCQNSTAVQNTCCFNAPGGQLLQVQFWDLTTGPKDSFTIHGLWPDNCDGTYQQFCDENRQYTNISSIIQQADPKLLSYMNTYWPNDNGTDESFWEHEWGKHGTCISTFDTKCYPDYTVGAEVPAFFNRTVSLFQSLPSYSFLEKAGITPSSTKTYSSTDIIAALKAGHGATPVIQCVDGVLNEVYYFYNVRGSVQTGDFVAVEPDGSSSNCPASVQYPPKNVGSSSTTTSSTPTSTPTPTLKTKGKTVRKPGAVQPRWT